MSSSGASSCSSSSTHYVLVSFHAPRFVQLPGATHLVEVSLQVVDFLAVLEQARPVLFLELFLAQDQ
jgi:hypothetical protein